MSATGYKHVTRQGRKYRVFINRKNLQYLKNGFDSAAQAYAHAMEVLSDTIIPTPPKKPAAELLAEARAARRKNTTVIYNCSACGYDQQASFTRCPKCSSTAIEKLTHDQNQVLVLGDDEIMPLETDDQKSQNSEPRTQKPGAESTEPKARNQNLEFRTQNSGVRSRKPKAESRELKAGSPKATNWKTQIQNDNTCRRCAHAATCKYRQPAMEAIVSALEGFTSGAQCGMVYRFIAAFCKYYQPAETP